MAKFLARPSTSFALRTSESICMDYCYFTNSGAYNLGILVDCNIGSGPNWFGCNNGWHCSVIGFLFHYALVENAVAKLKYVSSGLFIVRQSETLSGLMIK